MQCLKCLFNVDNHINQVRASCGRYPDFIHLLQNPKLPRTSVNFNNCNLSHKTQKDRALRNGPEQQPEP